MSIRGEITEAQKRQGERRVREGWPFDVEDFGAKPAWQAPSPPARAPVQRPQTLYEVGPWMARLGVRCGSAPAQAQDPAQ
jgi:hypothetical protein